MWTLDTYSPVFESSRSLSVMRPLVPTGCQEDQLGAVHVAQAAECQPSVRETLGLSLNTAAWPFTDVIPALGRWTFEDRVSPVQG